MNGLDIMVMNLNAVLVANIIDSVMAGATMCCLWMKYSDGSYRKIVSVNAMFNV